MKVKINTDLVKKHISLSSVTKDKFTESCSQYGISINSLLDSNILQTLDTAIKVSRLIKINMYNFIK